MPVTDWAAMPAMPTLRARARAKASTSLGLSGSRWSAVAPVHVTMLSTAYSRLIASGLPPSLASSPAVTLRTFRRLTKSRAYRTSAGVPAARKSQSRLRTTSALVKSYTGLTGLPNAATWAARRLSPASGSYCSHLAFGYCLRKSPITRVRVGEVVGSVTTRTPSPCLPFWASRASRMALMALS